MKMTINKNEFMDEFTKVRPESFSYEGLIALYKYFTAYEELTGEELELDVIAICCEYDEYDSAAEAIENYNLKDLEDLKDHTEVIEVENGHLIVKAF